MSKKNPYPSKRDILRQALDHINKTLVQAGFDRQYQVTHRYDYYGLDLHDTSGRCLRGPLATGTFEKCVNQAYIEAFTLITDKHFPLDQNQG